MLSSVVVSFRSNVSLSYFSSRILRTLRYSFIKCCCCCRLLFMISSFVSAASWCARCSSEMPPSKQVNGHSFTTCLIVWGSPQSQIGEAMLCMLLRHGPASVRNLLSRVHWPRGRCKMITHHKACSLPAVPTSRSKPASLMFRLNSQCNRRLTCSPKRLDLTYHKRLAVHAWANRDVFPRFLPSKDKLCNNQTERNVYMWMQH